LSTAANSILIIRPSALGDVCRSVPLAVSMRAAYPQAHIAWVVQDSFVDAVRSHPAVNEVVPFPRGRWRAWWKPSVMADFRRWVGALRGRFDLVLDAQGLGRSGLIAFSTRARRRVGFRDARELGWLGVTERYQIKERHTVDRMLGLLRAMGIRPIADLTLYVSEADRTWWKAERARLGIDDGYAVFAPTSRWITKDWPAERWAELAPAIRQRGHGSIVYMGTAGEAAQVQAALPKGESARESIDLSGKTTVGQGMAVIAESALVVANDSAPLHIAVGFARPLVALFGPTDPTTVGPYRRERAVVRSARAAAFRGSYRDLTLGDALMREISVSDVLAAIDSGRALPGRSGSG
jgi:heptosyltransferase-1